MVVGGFVMNEDGIDRILLEGTADPLDLLLLETGVPYPAGYPSGDTPHSESFRWAAYPRDVRMPSSMLAPGALS